MVNCMCVSCGLRLPERSDECVSILGIGCENSLNVLSKLSRDELRDASLILNCDGVSFCFSMYECYSVYPENDTSQSVLLNYFVVNHMFNSAVSSDVCDANGAGSATPDVSAVLPFPKSWSCFCESNFRGRNYNVSSNPERFKSLLELTIDVRYIVDESRKLLENNSKLSPDSIDYGTFSESAQYVLSRISDFIDDLKKLRGVIRKFVSCLLESLLFQFKHSLALGCSMILRLSLMIIPVKSHKISVFLSYLVEEISVLCQAISSVFSVGNFIPLEEMMEMLEKEGSGRYQSEINISSSFLGRKYQNLIESKKLRITHILSKFSGNEADEYVEKLDREIKEMEDFIEKRIGI